MAERSGGLKFPRPFESSYAASLNIAMLALIPFILVTTAFALYREQIGKAIHAGSAGLELILAFSTAGYAFGAMLGGDIVQRFPQRQLFLMCESAFIAGAIIAPASGGIVQFGIGQVLMGLATGFLLVVALPPVVQRFPPEKMPVTSSAVNLAFFGAVTAGPLVGGAVALGSDWRWFYGGLAGLGAIAIGLALFTLPDKPPPNPDLEFDAIGVLLALGATALPFWASGELRAHPFNSYWFMVPVAIGIACLFALLLVEYHKEEPLAPVKWTTFPASRNHRGGVRRRNVRRIPATGSRVSDAGGTSNPLRRRTVLVAASGGRDYSRVRAGAAGAHAISAGPDARRNAVADRRRRAAARIDASHPGIKLLASAGMLGSGAGATVSPGLWMAGFSLPAKMVARTLALVELVRSDADYLLSPVLMKVAEISSGGRPLHAEGAKEAIWITLLITIFFTVAEVVIYLLGTTKLPPPDLQGWLEEGRTAFESPQFGAAVKN